MAMSPNDNSSRNISCLYDFDFWGLGITFLLGLSDVTMSAYQIGRVTGCYEQEEDRMFCDVLRCEWWNNFLKIRKINIVASTSLC